MGRMTTVWQETADNVRKYREVPAGTMMEKDAVPRDKAMSGDIAFALELLDDAPAAGDGFDAIRVQVRLETDANEVHDWANLTITGGAAIADNATGTAALTSDDLVFVNGIAELEVTGTGAFEENDEITVTASEAESAMLGYTVDEVVLAITATE